MTDTDVTLLTNYDNMDLARSHVMILTSPAPLSPKEYPKDGYMAAGSFLFLKEQIKGIIIIT
jgi:hypothetical protein